MTDHNPYTPPAAKLETPERKQAPRHAFLKGLVAALAIDVGGSFFVSVVLAVIYSVQASMDGQSGDEIVAALEQIPHDSWISVIGMLCGGCLSFVGGYIGARFARQQETTLGIVQAACSVAFGLATGSGNMPFGMLVALSGLTVMLVMLGARFGAQRNRRGV